MFLQLFPQFAFKFHLRKIPTCKTYQVNLYSKPFNSFSCEDSFLCPKLLFTPYFQSGFISLTCCSINSDLIASPSKSQASSCSGFLHLRLPLAGMFIFQTAALPLLLGLVFGFILLNSLHPWLSYMTDTYRGLSGIFSNSTYHHLK